MNIKNYNILSQLYTSNRTTIYHALSEDNQNVLIKTTTNASDSAASSRLHHEFIISQKLDLAYIPKYIEVFEEDRSYLVMSFEPGQPLSKLIPQDGMDIDDFLHYAIALCEAIESMHTKGILHLDINPTNILCLDADKRIKLFDLGISTPKVNISKNYRTYNKFEGSVSYIAPEQTGLVNQSVDERSDLYSIGIVFYEMLTGNVPFSGSEQLEIIHAHLAKLPSDLYTVRQDISPIISLLVSKLLTKEKEARYNTAEGLKHDLIKIQDNKDAEFTLGLQDGTDKLNIPQKLYGRDAEIALARQKILSARNNRPQLIMISGYSGIGKSSFVNEMAPFIFQHNGYFIKGKFDQYNKSSSYTALSEVVKELVNIILKLKKKEKDEALNHLNSLLGDSKNILIKLFYDFGKIFQADSDFIIEQTQLKNQLFIALERLFGFFTRKNLLVIFLDDMQWSDNASLEILELIYQSKNIKNLLVIGAFRSNEVDKSHPLTLTLENISGKIGTIETISLGVLDQNATESLLKDTLKNKNIHSLAELILKKTDGNPFFLRQFILTLEREGLLWFDSHNMHWCYSLKDIQKQELTSNVIDHLIAKINILSENTRQVLKSASVIGDTFNVEAAISLASIQHEHPHDILEELINDGLIEPFYHNDSTVHSLHLNECAFVHDRIRQAAYSLIQPEEKLEMHLKIVRTRLEDVQQLDKKAILNIAHHAIEVIGTIKEEEKNSVFDILYRAAMYAKESLAYTEAIKYFTASLSILDDARLNKHYQRTFSVYENLLESYCLSINITEAGKLFTFLLNADLTVLDRAKVLNLRLIFHVTQGLIPESLNDGIEALKVLGQEIPNYSEALVALKSQEVKWLLSQVTNTFDLAKMPEMEDQKIVLCMKILVNMGIPAFVSRHDMFAVIALKMVKLSITYGNCSFSPYGYVLCGMIIGAGLGKYKEGYAYGNVGVTLLERFHNKSIECKLYRVYGAYIASWIEPHKHSLSILYKAYRSGIENGDFTYAGYCVNHIFTREFLLDIPLDKLEQKTTDFMDFLSVTKESGMYDTQLFLVSIPKNLQGKTIALDSFSSDNFDEDLFLEHFKSTGFMTLLAYYYIYKLQVCYLHELFDEAIENARIAQEYLPNLKGNILESEWVFYHALSLFRRRLLGLKNKEDLEILEQSANRFKIWCDLCPENFKSKYLMLKGIVFYCGGQHEEAFGAFDESMTLLDQSPDTLIKAVCAEIIGICWRDRHNNRIANVYLKEAFSIYLHFRAIPKTKLMMEDYAEITKDQSSFVTSSSTHSDDFESEFNIFDEDAIIRATSLISSKVNKTDLIDKLISIIVQSFGVQLCGLVLKKGKKFYVEGLFDIKHSQKQVLPHIKLRDCAELPQSVILKTIETKESIIIDDAPNDKRFAFDKSFIDRKIHSALCVPFFLKGELVGTVYMENNLISNFFDPKRIKILNILLTQTAISLDNANLFEKQKKIEAKLKKTNASLEQQVAIETEKRLEQERFIMQQSKLAALGEMIGNIAHQWRQPLNNLMIRKDLLIEDYYDKNLTDESIEKYSSQTSQTLQYLSQTIDDFRHFFKGSKEKEWFDVVDSINSAVAILGPSISKQNIRIDFECDLKHLKVFGFENEYLQVVLVIINNAKDAILSKHTEGVITIKILEQNGIVSSIFEDDGGGIPPEVMDKMFEPYFTTKFKSQGTGLGLYMAKTIIETNMHGKLHVKNAKHGAVFTIDLPVNADDR